MSNLTNTSRALPRYYFAAQRELDSDRGYWLAGLFPTLISEQLGHPCSFPLTHRTMGRLMTLADVLGFHYGRTSTPEFD